MPLRKTYPVDFERLWAAYPKYPNGRSNKVLAFEKFEKARRELSFTAEDIDALILDIEERKRKCVTWQRGNKFGPPAMQKYMRQHLWDEPYQKINENRSRYEIANEEFDNRPTGGGTLTPDEVSKLLRGTGVIH